MSKNNKNNKNNTITSDEYSGIEQSNYYRYMTDVMKFLNILVKRSENPLKDINIRYLLENLATYEYQYYSGDRLFTVIPETLEDIRHESITTYEELIKEIEQTP